MGLLSTLRNRFFAPELCRFAKSGDVAAMIACLARTPIVVVGADLGGSARLDADPNQIVALAEVAARKKSFDANVHKYEMDGDTLIPVFTDEASAKSFCGAYVSYRTV